MDRAGVDEASVSPQMTHVDDASSKLKTDSIDTLLVCDHFLRKNSKHALVFFWQMRERTSGDAGVFAAEVAQETITAGGGGGGLGGVRE